ncbi:hypothetical protein HDC93_004460 [Streptomyces sp. AK010]|nr:hypothetical protein [Streptomyces sp. AK010]
MWLVSTNAWEMNVTGKSQIRPLVVAAPGGPHGHADQGAEAGERVAEQEQQAEGGEDLGGVGAAVRPDAPADQQGDHAEDDQDEGCLRTLAALVLPSDPTRRPTSRATTPRTTRMRAA